MSNSNDSQNDEPIPIGLNDLDRLAIKDGNLYWDKKIVQTHASISLDRKQTNTAIAITIATVASALISFAALCSEIFFHLSEISEYRTIKTEIPLEVVLIHSSNLPVSQPDRQNPASSKLQENTPIESQKISPRLSDLKG